MGKRSRRRAAPGGFTDRTIASAEARPKAPWHPFPLVELCVLVGIVLIIVGMLDYRSRDGRTLLAMGLVLSSLAGLDTAARDHFSGFRSHSTLLAGLPAVLAAMAVYFSGAPWIAVLPAALVVFAGAFWWLRGQFRKRSGGLTFKA